MSARNESEAFGSYLTRLHRRWLPRQFMRRLGCSSTVAPVCARVVVLEIRLALAGLLAACCEAARGGPAVLSAWPFWLGLGNSRGWCCSARMRVFRCF